MALDFQKLENVRSCAGGFRAACPACREGNRDGKGEHLFIQENGRYGCAAFQEDGDHRRRVFELSGIFDPSHPSVRSAAGWPYPKNGSNSRKKTSTTKNSRLANEAADQLKWIVEENLSVDWEADLWDESPISLDGDPKMDWSLMLECLFPSDSTIFIGGPFDSGEKRGAGHFLTVKEWLGCPEQPGPRVTAATFSKGETRRLKDRVKSRLYLVLESDDLIGHDPTTDAERSMNKAMSAALFRWFVDAIGLRLAAVIDTGNKSLHGWFKMPQRAGMMKELKAIAPAFRLDTSLFNQPNAPVRLPGGIHVKTDSPARLLYLDQMT